MLNYANPEFLVIFSVTHVYNYCAALSLCLTRGRRYTDLISSTEHLTKHRTGVSAIASPRNLRRDQQNLTILDSLNAISITV